MELTKFYENIKIQDNLVIYEDEKGNVAVYSPLALICSCGYLEVTEEQRKVMEFNKEIKLTDKFNKIKTITQVTKENDPTTIVDKKIEVYQMWKVMNGAQAFKIFNSKEEALKTVHEINDKYVSKVK